MLECANRVIAEAEIEAAVARIHGCGMAAVAWVHGCGMAAVAWVDCPTDIAVRESLQNDTSSLPRGDRACGAWHGPWYVGACLAKERRAKMVAVAAANRRGLQPYSLQPYGLQPYGLQPYGLQPYSLQPYGLHSLRPA